LLADPAWHSAIIPIAQLVDKPETKMMTFVLVEVGVGPCFDELGMIKIEVNFSGLEQKKQVEIHNLLQLLSHFIRVSLRHFKAKNETANDCNILIDS